MTGQSLEDDDLRRRFIVGEITEDERRPIEERMFVDTSYFESLTALEHEMLIDLARGDLDARWARPLAKSLDASPDRRRHLDEVQSMLAALPKTAGPSRWYGWAAAAVLVLAAAGVARWGSAARETDATTPQAASAVSSFVLAPGPTRSPADAGNRIDLSQAAGTVRLVAVLDVQTDAVVTARAKPVGGDYVQIPGTTSSRRIANGLEVSWPVPAAAWAAGDYLIEYSAGRDAGSAAIIGTRFVRIER